MRCLVESCPRPSSIRPPKPYLGLLKERGPLFILDVCDLALLYLQRGGQPGDSGRSCAPPSPVPPTLTPGLAYLDVMALWDHNVLLGEQVLHSILRDDVLHLKEGGEGAGARPGSPTAQQGHQSRRAGSPTGSCKHTPWEGWSGGYCLSPKWSLGCGHSRQGVPLTWLSEVTRCCTVWPSAVISWM